MKRDGKPVVGFAFNSTGRYACGAQMRARFIPRLLKADPKSLVNEAGDNIDPAIAALSVVLIALTVLVLAIRAVYRWRTASPEA